MLENDVASKLKGWNSISDISKKLNVKKSTAYVYVHKLSKKGFVIRKIKKPRGTMYLIDPIPVLSKNRSMFEGTEMVSPELEFSNTKIPPEHKIAYLIQMSRKERNVRYRAQAKNFVRSIKNWKRLYRYLKAYDVVDDFRKFYIESRKDIKKIPRMPERYKKLLGV